MGENLCEVLTISMLIMMMAGVKNARAVQKATADPLVAFTCGNGAMHMDAEEGWKSDSLTDCLNSKEDILTYCQNIYPKSDIRNVVESTEKMTISGWCPVGSNACQNAETLTVQVYRCLKGEFQSDALVVPAGCSFHHVYKPDTCSYFIFWHDMAVDGCLKQTDMVAHSFGMLEPCGTDLWTGVEYVCCPQGERSIEHLDPVSQYEKLQMQAGQYSNEHEAYESAKHRQMQIYREKSVKIMEEWHKARARVVEMQESDPKQAEIINKEISDQYSGQYLAAQSEEEAAINLLDTVHQQRVQTNLNYKKRASMQKLMEELQSDMYDIGDISHLLQNYISIEQKDAVHCVKHFIKVRTKDPKVAEGMLPSTIEHLFLISKRINQSIDVLDTLDDRKQAEALKTRTITWVKQSSFNIDETLQLLKSLPLHQARGTTTVLSAADVKDAEALSGSFTPLPQFRKASADGKPADDAEGTTQNTVLKQNEVVENELTSRSDVRFGVLDQVIGASKTMSAGAAVASASGVVAALMVILLVVIFVKKKSSRVSKRCDLTYLEIPPAVPDLSSEDRHTAAMQNGYQNPTYALLEQRNLKRTC